MPGIPLLLLDTEAFALRSSSFSNGAPIPVQYSLQGGNLSPPLSWSNAPANTNSFVLIMDDPDAPGGTWDHWIIYNIPAGTTSFAENAGASGDGGLPSGAEHGTNSWGNKYYQGPSPPSGTHRYYFKLYALSVFQLNPSGTTKAAIEAAMAGKIMDQTELMGTYTY
jgi:Raf kinase inhibitor-like YbhB/YbcL family protein